MLYGKIIPAATFVKQVTPFETTSTNANYISALARPYGLGAKKVNFEVLFGNIHQNENGENQFERVSSYPVMFEENELGDWGVDDTVMLNKIAEKLNVTISDFITINQDRLL